MSSTERPSPELSILALPQSPSEFDHDPRISFSRLENKWILETDEGTEYEYDLALKRWIQVNHAQLDQTLLEEQGKAYKVEGVDEDAPTGAQKKRKKQYVNGEEEQPPPKSKKPRVNRAVYVTGLPRDDDNITTFSELQDVFSKCGVIAEEIDSQKPRIKMYEDDQGRFKGEALIVYFRPESVQLAVQMLDDTSLRFGEAEKMKVQPADYSYKSQQEAPSIAGGFAAVKSAHKGERRQVIKKTQKLNDKLADWSDDDYDQGNGQINPSLAPSRADKMVVLKHMFTLDELESDPSSLLDIKEDIREECEERGLGPITNISLYDLEPQGVVTVRFASAEAANECVRLMNNRWFDQRQVIAYVSSISGIKNEKFRRSGNTSGGHGDEQDVDEEEEEEEAAAAAAEGADVREGDGRTGKADRRERAGGSADDDGGVDSKTAAGGGDRQRRTKQMTEQKRLDRFGEWLEGR